jgi:hypothetical protein
MVHHCILSSCGNLDTKWGESRSKPQNWDFHSNLLQPTCWSPNWENDYVSKPVKYNQGAIIILKINKIELYLKIETHKYITLSRKRSKQIRSQLIRTVDFQYLKMVFIRAIIG